MSTNVNSLLSSVPKLGGEKADGITTTYHDWKFAISMVLRRAGCWEVLTQEKPSTRDALKAWETKSEEMLTAIGLTIDPGQYQYISDATTGPEAWTKLSTVYQKNSRANHIALMRQFYGARHHPNKPICDYINPIIQVAAQLKAIGVKVEDETIIDVLIMNLDETWSNIAATLAASTGLLSTPADVTGLLINEEGRRTAGNDLMGSSDLALVGKGKSYHPNITCYTCGKRGHLARNCRNGKEKTEEKKRPSDQVNVSTDDYAF